MGARQPFCTSFANRRTQLSSQGPVHWLTHETNVVAQARYDRVADRAGFVQYRKNL